MDDLPKETAAPRKTSVSIREIAHHADAAAAERLANVFNKGKEKIGAPKVLERIAAQSDLYDGEEWKGPAWDTFGDYFSARRARLSDLLNDTTEETQVVDALRTWTEEEMQNLFFVTNDIPTTYQMLDYYYHFYPNFLKELETSGRMSAKLGQYAREDIECYVTCCLEGYEHLRGLVMRASGDKFPSLVRLAHAASGAQPEVWKDRTSVLDAHKREAIMQESRSLLKEMIQSNFLERDDENFIDPLDVYLVCEASQIAVLALGRRYPHTGRLKRTPPTMEAEEDSEARRILTRCYKEVIKHEDHIGAAVKLTEILNEEERKVADLPENFPDIYQRAVDAAQDHCDSAGCEKYWREHREALNFERPISAEGDLGVRLWPWYGTQAHVAARLQFFGEEITDRKKNPISLREWTTTFENIADAYAKRVLLAMDCPEMLLYLRDYIDTFISHATLEFKAAHKYKSNEREFKALAAVRDKCTALHDAVVEWQYWTLEATNGNYDKPAQVGHIKLLSEVPVTLEELYSSGKLDVIASSTAVFMKDLVKQHGLIDAKHRYRSDPTFFPLIYRWAQETAEANATRVPAVGQKHNQAEYDGNIKSETLRLFHQSLAKLAEHKRANHIPSGMHMTAEDVSWLKQYFKEPHMLRKFDIARPSTSARIH